MEPIQMVDLRRQYLRLRPDIDRAISEVVGDAHFINGPQVRRFAESLESYLEVPHVVTCGNGTDALQIALMALDLRPGDEVIVPAFTYVAAAEVVALLGLIPVWVDVDPATFTINPSLVEGAISGKTKAIVAVHLFGQCADMEPLMRIANENGLYLIEDNAQSLGADYRFPDGHTQKAGTIGHIGTTSFFPSKPLACFGDGGALMTADDYWAERARMIASHGQKVKYHHQILGCNSRLDTLQAAVLEVKLPHLAEFNAARQAVAARYAEALRDDSRWIIPQRAGYSSHLYHQYTLRINDRQRDGLRDFLTSKGIPSMIYYPLPMQKQEAFYGFARKGSTLDVADSLSETVLSLPIHTEMTDEEVLYIIDTIKRYEY